MKYEHWTKNIHTHTQIHSRALKIEHERKQVSATAWYNAVVNSFGLLYTQFVWQKNWHKRTANRSEHRGHCRLNMKRQTHKAYIRYSARHHGISNIWVNMVSASAIPNASEWSWLLLLLLRLLLKINYDCVLVGWVSVAFVRAMVFHFTLHEALKHSFYNK